MSDRVWNILQWVGMGIVMTLVVLFSLHTITSVNQDIGRHIRIGEIIWQEHSIPATNAFSFTAPDFPFINHHWLGSVFLYLGASFVGLKGLIIVKAILFALAFGLVIAAGHRKDLTLATLWITILALFIAIERTDVRPEILSFLFLGWFLFVLFRKHDSRLIWTLPFIQMVWVNTHIYFFMGVAIFGAFLLGEIVRRGTVRFPEFKKFAFVGLSIVLATLINSAGWQGALYPLFIFQNYGYSIVENQSPFFLQAFNYPSLTTNALFIGITLTVVSFFYNVRKIRENIFSLLLFITTSILALTMIRNFPLFALAVIPINLKNLREGGFAWRNPLALGATYIIMLTLGVSVVSNQIYAQAGLGRKFGLEVPEGAQAAVEYVREHSLRGPMFNNFDIGSFLIWKLPEEKVFIDGRPEAYPADFIQRIYIPMQEDPDAWERYAQQYNIQLIFFNYYDITPWAQKFLQHIMINKKWATVYRDRGIIILVRNTSERRQLIESF